MAELKKATPDVVETWINKAFELVFTGRLGNSYDEIARFVRSRVKYDKNRAVDVDPELVRKLAEEANIEVTGCERAVVDAAVRKSGRTWPRQMAEILELIDLDFHGDVDKAIKTIQRIKALGNSQELLRVLADYQQLETLLGTGPARAAILKQEAQQPANSR